MKITTDVNLVHQNRSGRDVQGVSKKTAQGAASHAKLSNGISSRLQQERSLIDAMAIAQVSRSVVQKAINVSARLSSIAFQAMSTGNIDVSDLNSQMSDINGVMANYGENVLSPPDSRSHGSEYLSKIADSAGELARGASEMAEGRAVAPKRFDAVTENLGKVASNIDGDIRMFGEKLGRPGTVFAADSDIPDIAVKTVQYITDNPGAALAGQGNILAEAARALTIE